MRLSKRFGYERLKECSLPDSRNEKKNYSCPDAEIRFALTLSPRTPRIFSNTFVMNHTASQKNITINCEKFRIEMKTKKSKSEKRASKKKKRRYHKVGGRSVFLIQSIQKSRTMK